MGTDVRNPADRRRYPSRWPMRRGKELFKEIDERSPHGSEELLSVSHITGITPRSEKNVTMFQSESLVGYKICRRNDIAANTMWTWQGAIGVSAYDGVISPSYNVYRQRQDFYNPRYLDFLLREPALVDVYDSLSTGIRPSRRRLYPEEFLTIRFPVPKREEQDRIVNFLAEKSSEIDKVVSVKQKQIDELEELKKTIIHRAVTSGVRGTGKGEQETRGRVSSRAEMPQEWRRLWTAALPNGWKMVQLRRKFNVILGKMLSPEASTPSDVRLKYICAKDVHFEGVDLSDLKEMWYAPDEIRQYQVRDGDLLIVEGGAGAGNSAMVKGIGSQIICVQNSILIVRPKETDSTSYLCYCLTDLVKRGYMNYVCSVATIPHYTKDKVLSTPIPFPSPPVQREIVAYLDEKCAAIDGAIANKRKSIEELSALKSRIIADAVTGRMEVE